VFHLRSRDVIHSFFVPQFRLEAGRFGPVTRSRSGSAPTRKASTTWVCAELCGWGHYKMAGRVRVVSKDEIRETHGGQ